MERPDVDECLVLAEEADSKLNGEEQGEWLSRLEGAREDLLRALSACVRENSPQALRLCAALVTFWRMRGYIAEGLQQCEAVLNMECAENATKERAKILNGAGTFARMEGDYAVAESYHEQSLTIHEALGDKKGAAASFNGLGNLAIEKKEFQEAKRRYEQSLAIKREIGDKAVIAGSLNNLGYLAYQQGDWETARRRYQESLTLRCQAGNMSLQETLSLLQGLAETATAERDWKNATCLFGAAKALCERPEGMWLAFDVEAFERDADALRCALGEGAFGEIFAQGRAMSLKNAIDMALTL